MKFFLTALSIAMVAIPMEKPPANPANTDSFLACLPTGVREQSLLPYVVTPAPVRDNRRDCFIEQARNIDASVTLAQSEWGIELNSALLVDTAVNFARKNPEETSHFSTNPVSVTTALRPGSYRQMRELLLGRMGDFNRLSAADKNKAVLDAIKVCPSATVIYRMITAGASVDAVDPVTQCSLLHHAVRAGKGPLIAYLVQMRAKKNQGDSMESTPLHYAVRAGDIEAARLLLSGGAPNDVDCRDAQGFIPLFYAVEKGHEALVDLLVAKGSSIYYYTDIGDWAAVFKKNVVARAAKKQPLGIVRTLLEARNPAQAVDRFSLSTMVHAALIAAVRKGRRDIVNYMLSLEGVNIHPDMYIGDNSALVTALAQDHLGIGLNLLHYSRDNCSSIQPHFVLSRSEALAIAVEKLCALNPEHPRAASRALQLNALIDEIIAEFPANRKAALIEGRPRENPGFIAAERGNGVLLQRLLVPACAYDVNAPARLLLAAAGVGSVPAVHTLLDCGVPPSVRNERGDTPLHKALKVMTHENMAIFDDLIAHGADVAAKTYQGQTPLHEVMKHFDVLAQEEIVKKIIAQLRIEGRLAEVDALDCEGNTPLHALCNVSDDIGVHLIRPLIDAGAHINQRNKKGQTPLFLACAKNAQDKAYCLLERGADPNITNNSGCGPLGKAARHGNQDLILTLIDAGALLAKFQDAMLREAVKGQWINVMQWLLDQGAAVNGRSTSFGSTPLHKAVRYKQLQAAQFLLKHGASPHARDAKGNTPLDVALAQRNDTKSHELVDLLMEHLSIH